MGDIENVLDNEPVAEAEEDTGEAIEETDAAGEDADDDFEYDEEGNIVIPDVEFDPEEDELNEDDEEDTPEEEPEDESEDEGSGEEEKTTVDEKEQKAEEIAEEVAPEPDPKDKEIESLKTRLQAIEKQARATLKTIGVEEEDPIVGLVKVAAEAENKTPEEYNAEIAKQEADETARIMLRNQLYEAKAAADLKELHAAYPETRQYKHIKELPPEILKTFGAQRDAGFSVKQAYAAANPDGIRKDVATSVKKQAMHDSKEHLKSSVPKPSKTDENAMSKAELVSWRELFPEMSDAEIKKLYKQSQ